MDSEYREKRAAERKSARIKVEFFVDADVIEAKSVDISKIGIRFNTGKPIEIHMRLYNQGRKLDSMASLVWARKLPDGSVTYGFEYIPENEDSL
ncbi:MAG: PilZ domain-containing protein [Gemmatimonadota bacterium]|nr:PilZ domain-containing protein [Gemmatimonadota bacterium]